MAKPVSIVMLFLLITSMWTLALKIQPARAADVDDWPMFHHDPSHTGTSTSPAPTTNNTLWSYTTGDQAWASPAVADGLVYVGITPGPFLNDYIVSVYCLNATSGSQVWNYKWSGGLDSSPAVADGLVYVGIGPGPYLGRNTASVYCLNAATGARVWSYRTGTNVESSPVVVGGLVYVGSEEDHSVYCLNATTGALVWIYATGDLVDSSPAVAGGLVYVGSFDGNVYCLNAATGALVWNYTTGSYVESSPAVAGSLVYVGSNGGNVYCLNAATGALVWNYTTGGGYSSPAVAGSLVYVGSGDGNVYCLNAATGALVWNYTTGNEVDSSPAVVGGLVYVGSFDGNVYCLNAATGALVWNYQTGFKVRCSPAVANGVVYIGSFGGNIYAFGSSSSPQSHSVSFSESGLAQGTQWNVTFNGQTQSSTANSITFNAPNGVYPFSITPLIGYTASPSSGSITVNGADVEEEIAFSAPSLGFTVSTFGNLFTVNKGGSVSVPVIVNLVSGITEQVSLSVAWIPTGSNQWFTTSFSTTSGDPPFTSTLSITTSSAIPDGTYTAQILASEGGNVKSTTVTVAVNPHYNVTFTQVGLATGTQWSVTFNGQTQPSYSDSITFYDVANGVYSFSAATTFPGYVALPASSDLGVNLENTTTDVIFAPSSNSYKLTSWDPARDSYNTRNFQSSFGDYFQTWLGNCFGISSTAELYFRNYTLGDSTYPCFPSQSPQATSTSDLDLGVNTWSSLNDASLAVMFHQVYDPENSILLNLILKSNPPLLLTEFNQLKTSLDAGIPAVLLIWSSSSSHAVVAWGYTTLENGSFAISIYDSNYPESTQVAIYNPTLTGDFYYLGLTGPYYWFVPVDPSVINTSWFNVWVPLPVNPFSVTVNPFWMTNWLNCSVTGYYIVVADKMVSVTSGGSTDYFTTAGNSQTLVDNIPGTSGIEEGNMQVYAIPTGVSFNVVDPSIGQSTLLITHVDNESGQLVGYAYLLNVTSTQGDLNYTVTPSASGLSINAGNNALNANVTCFYATEQNCSFSQALNKPVGALQTTNFTVSNWQTLNDTGIQVIPEFPDGALGVILTLSAVLFVVLATVVRRRKIRMPQGVRSS